MAETVSYKKRPTPLAELFLTILAWIKFLLSKWLILLAFVIVGGGLGILYAFSVKPLYESRLSFALDEGGSGSMNGAMSIAAQLGINIAGNNSEVFGGDNIVEIMKSRKNVEKVLLSVDSSDNPPATMIDKYLKIVNWKKLTSKKPWIQNISFPVNQDRSTFSYLQDSVLCVIYEKFSKDLINASRPDKRLNIFEVRVVTPNEKFTKIFTDRLVAFTSVFYTEIRTKKSKATLDVLEVRANATKELLNSSISNKAATQDANVNPAFATVQAPLQKQQFNIQAYGSAYGELYKNLELARFQYLKEVPLLQIIDEANYPMKKIRFGGLKGLLIGSALGLLLGMIIVIIIRFSRLIKNGEIG